MTDIEQLKRTIGAFPREHRLLEMLAGAYRERGDERNAAATMLVLEIRVAARELTARLIPVLAKAQGAAEGAQPDHVVDAPSAGPVPAAGQRSTLPARVADIPVIAGPQVRT